MLLNYVGYQSVTYSPFWGFRARKIEIFIYNTLKLNVSKYDQNKAKNTEEIKLKRPLNQLRISIKISVAKS